MKKNCGYIRISRCLEEHPVVGVHVRDGKYTLGWLRLLWRAAYKPRNVQRGRETITLDRGQISISERALAADFGWSYKEVRTFIQALKKHDMITVSAGAQKGAQGGAKKGAQMGASWPVITICNYDEYQACAGEDGAEKGAQGGAHIGAQTGADSNKGNKYNNPSSGISSSLRYEDIPSPLPTGSGPDAPSAVEGPGQIDIEELTTPGRGEPAPVAKVEAKPSKAAEKRAQAEQVLAKYAEVAKRFKLPAPKKLNDHRIRAVSARVAEYGLDGVLAAIDEIPMSRLLRGEATDWTPDFDWFFKPAKFTKIAEGGHRDEKYRRREGWTKDARKDWRNDIRDGETLRQACERNGEDVEFWESQYPPGQFDSIEYAR